MLELQFSPFPEIRTNRLLLRRLNRHDAAEVLFLRSDPAVLKYLDKEPEKDLEGAVAFIDRVNQDIDNNAGIQWGIVLPEAPGAVIGMICYWRVQKDHYRAELGYALHPARWRMGIMKEAIAAVLEYGFSSLGLHSVEARINPENSPSAAILEASGFKREAYFKEDFFFHGHFGDTAVYSLLTKSG